MKKTTCLLLVVLSGLFCVLYSFCVLAQSKDLSNLVAPASTLCAGLALILAACRTKDYRVLWLLAGLASISYMVGDAGWAFTAIFLKEDPEQSVLLMFIYAVPNLLLAAAAAALVGSCRKVWHRVQLLTDVLAASFIGLTIIWIIFLNNAFNSLLGMDLESLNMFFYAFTDIFILCCLTVWLSTLDGQRIAASLRIFLLGLLFYTLVDLFYSYQYFNDVYEANSILDILYLMSFLAMALAGLIQTQQKEPLARIDLETVPEKGRQIKKVALLLLVPVGLVLFNDFNWQEILFLLAIIVSHQIINSYIRSARISEKLLLHEKQMNQILEEQIAMRTKELVSINRELEIVSNHDSITNFYNRRYFLIAFDRMLKEARTQESIVLFFADLDRFKTINDTFGHDIGDQVLVEIAMRMKHWNDHNATIARLGGDEFVIAIRGGYQAENAAELASELIRQCSEPISIPPYQFHITMSLGITFYPFDAQDRSALMKNADIAMYHAKSQGCNQFAFFSSLINDQVTRKSEMEMLLRNADYDHEFELHYQPQYAIATGALTGAEALLLWNSPVLGPVSPTEFIPLAEEIGTIIPLGEWVMRRAADQIRIWNEQYGLELKISINISPKQLDSSNFLAHLQLMIDDGRIRPDWLEIEIIENVAMKGEEPVMRILQALSGIGIAVSIDEFGTGYSSLLYLKKFAIDRLKIARPLIENIALSSSDYQITKAIILMAKALGIQTTAEGVETAEQLQILADLECDEVQGYLTGQPMTADQMTDVCLKNRQLAAMPVN